MFTTALSCQIDDLNFASDRISFVLNFITSYNIDFKWRIS
jgi:hypothetical protein